jgi:hypothetical protein
MQFKKVTGMDMVPPVLVLSSNRPLPSGPIQMFKTLMTQFSLRLIDNCIHSIIPKKHESNVVFNIVQRPMLPTSDFCSVAYRGQCYQYLQT